MSEFSKPKFGNEYFDFTEQNFFSEIANIHELVTF